MKAALVVPDIYLSEEGGIRNLHFGSPWIQGAMHLRRPNELVLEYQRHMMAWLLFLHAPKSLVQLGLGAAGLTRFSLKHLPETVQSIVEISPAVIRCCEQAFRLDTKDRRVKILRQDALAFVANAKPNSVPVLQVDLYDWTANGPVYESEKFYRYCFDSLQAPGVLVVNLFGEHASFARNLAHIDKLSHGRFLCLAAREASNVVVLAFKGPAIDVTWESMNRRAAWLERKMKLPARAWVETIRNMQPRSLRSRDNFAM